MSIDKLIKRGRHPKTVDLATLGGKIRAAREKAGLTTTQLGDKIGVSDVTITRTENNQTNPARRTLILLAQTLGNNFGLKWLDEHIDAQTQSHAGASSKEAFELRLKMRAARGNKSLERVESGTNIGDADAERLMIMYRELPPESKKVASNFVQTLWAARDEGIIIGETVSNIDTNPAKAKKPRSPQLVPQTKKKGR